MKQSSNELTASKKAKQAGLKSLADVARTTKQSATTLRNWHNNKPELFEIVLMGCVMANILSRIGGGSSPELIAAKLNLIDLINKTTK